MISHPPFVIKPKYHLHEWSLLMIIVALVHREHTVQYAIYRLTYVSLQSSQAIGIRAIYSIVFMTATTNVPLHVGGIKRGDLCKVQLTDNVFILVTICPPHWIVQLVYVAALFEFADRSIPEWKSKHTSSPSRSSSILTFTPKGAHHLVKRNLLYLALKWYGGIIVVGMFCASQGCSEQTALLYAADSSFRRLRVDSHHVSHQTIFLVLFSTATNLAVKRFDFKNCCISQCSRTFHRCSDRAQ